MSGTVLITGASGFIGQHLISGLVKEGYRVRAASRRPDAIRVSPEVDAVRVEDFEQPIEWAPILDGIDSVVHLAGIAHQNRRGTSPASYLRVNRDATAELARQAGIAGVRRFVFMSSIMAQVAHTAAQVLTERDNTMPQDNAVRQRPYGGSKLEAEAAVRASGTAYTILRPVVVYGPHVKGNVARLLRLADSPWPLPLAAFENRRSLLALDNLVAAVSFALTDAAAHNETYIVADPSALTLAEIVRVLRASMGRPHRLFSLSPQVFRTIFALAGRSEHWQLIGGSLAASPAKLLSAGWRPVVDTPDGLARFARESR